jgi:hypothetical protein
MTDTINFCVEKIESYFDAIACCDIEGRLKVSNMSLLEEIDPSNDDSTFNRKIELKDFFGQNMDFKSAIKNKLFSYLCPIEVTRSEITELKNQISERRILNSRNFSRSRVDLSLVVSALKLNTNVIFLCQDLDLHNTFVVLRNIPQVIINNTAYLTKKLIPQSVSIFLRKPCRCCEIEFKDYLDFVLRWGIQCTQSLSPSSDSFTRHFSDIAFITKGFEEDGKEKYQSQI